VAWCRAADDFTAIRARMDELRRERSQARFEKGMPSGDGRTINAPMTYGGRRRVEELIKAVRARRAQERRQ